MPYYPGGRNSPGRWIEYKPYSRREMGNAARPGGCAPGCLLAIVAFGLIGFIAIYFAAQSSVAADAEYLARADSQPAEGVHFLNREADWKSYKQFARLTAATVTSTEVSFEVEVTNTGPVRQTYDCLDVTRGSMRSYIYSYPKLENTGVFNVVRATRNTCDGQPGGSRGLRIEPGETVVHTAVFPRYNQLRLNSDLNFSPYFQGERFTLP